MKYDLVPLNGKVLLKRATLDLEDKQEEKPVFAFEDPKSIQIEYFEIIKMSKDCPYTFHETDIVTVENYTPIGVFDEAEMFVCDARMITCRILPVNELTTKK